MGTNEKPAQRKTLSGVKNPVQQRRELAQDALSAGGSYLKDKILEDRPYLKIAFKNPYNITTLLGGLAIGGMALGPVGVAGVLAAEALWLLWAPSSTRLQHILWDPHFDKLREKIEAQEREQKTKDLPLHQKERIATLIENKQKIERLAEQNPSFSKDLLKGELVKTARLVDNFIEMAVRCTRYESYLESIDLRDLERDRQRWETKMRTGKAGEQDTEIAKKNYAIILKRLDKLREIREFLSVTRGQLDLIENSFKLIADQIVTMQSPGELVGQLDELMTGVEAIRESTIDTEKMLQGLEI